MQMAMLRVDNVESRTFHTYVCSNYTLSIIYDQWPTHHFLPAVVLYKNCMAHHDVAKGSNGHWHQSVPGGEQVEEEDVQQARDGGA